MNADKIQEAINRFNNYIKARKSLLSYINCTNSCREPFAEFSEYIVAQLLNSELAESRVQKGYDLIRPDGRKVQVKYLANPTKKWINEHHMKFEGNCDDYAIVIITDFKIEGVVVFKKETIEEVCNLLVKRHPNQENSLQFTRRNFDYILNNVSQFKELGVEVLLLN